jgi:hypothetical protein
MRNGQNKQRMRGRNNNRKGQNPMSRVYESNGPDVKIRGTPSHVAEKYVQLARDAQASGDPVAAENYYQHAEHYFRLIATAQEQFRVNSPQFYRPDNDTHDEPFEDGDDEDSSQQPSVSGGEPAFGTRDPQPYLPRDAQPFPHQLQPQPQLPPQHHQPHHQPQHGGPRSQPPGGRDGGDVDRLPSFITGGGTQPPHAPQQAYQPPQGHGQNGHDNQGDRFPLHRRRRRHRGPRHDLPGGAPANDGEEPSPRGD